MISSIILARRRLGSPARAIPATFHCQCGAFAVEFAIVALLFLTIVFTILEISRALFLWNALQEVTRRAAREASVTDFSNASAIEKVQQNAIFRDSSGKLILGAPVTEKYVRIDYLSLQDETKKKQKAVEIPKGSMPGCPTRNKLICTAKSGDPNCIRLIRVRICHPASTGVCSPVPYQPILPLVNFPFNLPVAETIVRAQSLGYVPGMPVCE